MNYPKRGCVSEDGKFYTHTDGRVFKSSMDDCRDCDIAGLPVSVKVCGEDCKHGWSRIEGAYVNSDEEQEACDMARAMIKKCAERGGKPCDALPGACSFWLHAACPARLWLAKHHQADAWEVKK